MFQGEDVSIPLGPRGMTSPRNLNWLPMNAPVRLRNISIREGNFRCCGGSIKYNVNPIAAAPITGVYNYWPTPLLSRILAYLDNGASASLYEDLGTKTFPVQMAQGLRPGGLPIFAEGGAESEGRNFKLFMVNGIDAVAVIDGDAHVTRAMGLSPGSPNVTLVYSGGTGTFAVNEIVDDNISGASGKVASLGAGVLYLVSVQGTFSLGDSITGEVSGATATVTTATITGYSSTAPNDWKFGSQPLFLRMHNNRLVGALGHRIYGSTVIDHEDFQGEGSYTISVYPGIGRRLQGAVSFNSRLYMWKYPEGIYWLDDSSTLITDWCIYALNGVLGLAGPDAFCETDNDVLWVAQTGHVHLLSAVQNFGDVESSDISMQQQFHYWIEDNVDTTEAGLFGMRARYFPDLREAHITARPKYGNAYSLRIIVDFNAPAESPRFRYEDKDTCQSLDFYTDAQGNTRPMSGDKNGTVWLLNDPSLAVAGQPITSEFQFPDTDFRAVNKRYKDIEKNFHWLEASFEPRGNWNLIVEAVIDGRYKQTLTFPMGGVALDLDTMVLDTSLIGGNVISKYRQRLRGSGRSISLRGKLVGVGQDFCLSDLTVGFTPGSTKFPT